MFLQVTRSKVSWGVWLSVSQTEEDDRASVSGHVFL